MSYGANRCISGGVRHRTYKCSGDARAVKAEYCPGQEEDPRESGTGRHCNDYSAGDRPEDNGSRHKRTVEHERTPLAGRLRPTSRSITDELTAEPGSKGVRTAAAAGGLYRMGPGNWS